MDQDAYRFPAEWETHSATWLTWPHNQDTWPSNLQAAQAEFDRLARTLAEVELVHLIANEELSPELKRRFDSQPNITVVEISTNDSWIRDYGPTFVKSKADGCTVGVNWIYNGWGEKYPPFDFDQQAATAILTYLDLPRLDSKLILEGGSIESNGLDTCLSTIRCITTRNPECKTGDLIAELSLKLGLERVLLLDCLDIPGDDTDGHIDQVARFVSDKQVVVSGRHEALVRPVLEENGFELIALPEPDEVWMHGSVLPASYTNFYFANGLVVVPEFGVPQDDAAKKLLTELCPQHQVIGLPSRELTVGLGSFHCLTQQQPA